jgi:hypothetical protein
MAEPGGSGPIGQYPTGVEGVDALEDSEKVIGGVRGWLR